MQFNDPFSADTSKYKSILNKDAGTEGFEYLSAEEILNNNTTKGLPPDVFKLAQERVNKIKNNEELKHQVGQVFNQLFQDLNAKYGLNVQFDVDSFTSTISYMIEPRNKKAMEYYLSEAYSRFRVAMYQQFLTAIALLATQILDPMYLLSESMTYDQKLDTMERLFNFMETIETVYEKVNVPDTAVKLEKLGTDQRQSRSIDDPDVRNFLENFFNNIKEEKQLESK